MAATQSFDFFIRRIHGALEKEANRVLRDFDLTAVQMIALLVLRDTDTGELPLKDLEHTLRVAQSTAAGIVSRLEQKGFVEPLQDPGDRRIKRVRLTPAGVQCCRNADQSLSHTEQKILSGLTPTEREILFSLLSKVVSTLD